MLPILLAFVVVASAELAKAVYRITIIARDRDAASVAYASRVQSNGAGTGAYWTL